MITRIVIASTALLIISAIACLFYVLLHPTRDDENWEHWMH
jgi:hypothetical protein